MKARPTRTGVFTYTRADGSTVRELRHPDEVFHPDSLASLEDVPVTIRHPRELRVTPRTHQRDAVGHVRAGSVRADGQFVASELVIASSEAQAMAQAPARPELSAGYDMIVDPTPGVYEGERYDQAQTRIRYHHVAMLRPGEGRAGRECRLDAAGEEIPNLDESTEETPMKIKIGGKVYENEAEAQEAISKLEARADAATEQVKSLTATVAKHDAEAAKTRRDALVERVRSVMGKDFSVTRKDAAGAEVELSDRELRLAVIRRTDSKFDDKDRDDVYVEARFDHTFAATSNARAIVDALNTPVVPEQTRADAEDKDGPRARAAAIVENAKKRGISV